MAIQQSINNMLGTVGTVAGIASALDKSSEKDAAAFEAEKANREFKADIEEAAMSNQLKMPKNPTDEQYNKLYNKVQHLRNNDLKNVKKEVENTRKLSDTLNKENLDTKDINYIKGEGYQIITGQNGENAFYDPKTREYMSKEQFASRAVQDQNRALNRLRERHDRINTTAQLKFNKETAYQNYQNIGKGLIGKMIFNMKEGNK